MTKVNLVQTWTWQCPECSHHNHSPGSSMQPDEATLDAAREAFGEDVKPHELQCVPERVVCGNCLSEHETQYNDEETL